jgi:hypothetical protein
MQGRWSGGAGLVHPTKSVLLHTSALAPPLTPNPIPPPGEFTVVNQHLLHDLTTLGLWNPALKNELVAASGSVAGIDGIPDDLKVR